MTLSDVEKACERLVAVGITPNHFLILSSVSQKDVSMSDLAHRCQHSTAASTGVIDVMEKLGLVERTRPIDDRRKVLVRITNAGREKLNSVVQAA